MRQVILGGADAYLSNAGTRYNRLYCGGAWGTVEFSARQLVASAGKIKSLRIKLAGAPGAGKRYNFTLLLNGSPTALTVEVADAATTGSDMVNEVDVVGGDAITLECVPTGTPSTVKCTWTSAFEGTTANESLILGSTFGSPVSAAATGYSPVMGGYSPSATENDNRQICPTAGTIKNFYVALSADPGTAPDGYRFTIRKGGIDQTLTVTITADNITGSDLVHSFAVAAGNVLTMKIEPLNAPSAAPAVCWGLTFLADVDGESIVLAGSQNSPSTSGTNYIYPNAYPGALWSGVEASGRQLGQACTLKKLRVLLSAAPGVGNSYDFIMRNSGADTDLTVHIHNTDTTGNSGALTTAIADDDYMVLRSAPTATKCRKINGITSPSKIIGKATTGVTKVNGVPYGPAITSIDAYWGFVVDTA